MHRHSFIVISCLLSLFWLSTAAQASGLRVKDGIVQPESLHRFKSPPLRVIGSEVIAGNVATPSICVEFFEPLAQTGVDYDPFVRRKDEGLLVQVHDTRRLCVTGIAHGKRYRLTLRQGLPAASGNVLSRDIRLNHFVPNLKPSVRFPGRGYVLPKSAEAALSVETVNVPTLNLILRRVSDRNLLRALYGDFFGSFIGQSWREKHFSSEIAEDIWTGTAEIAHQPNQTVTTRLPMAEAIADQPTGIYALTARIPNAKPFADRGATQWFVLSDLGISTVLGTDGLHATVRGLQDAKPRPGIRVSLISKANSVIADQQTDTEGYVHFEAGLTRGTGSSAPALLIASEGDRDFSFLLLTDPAFDLSDRGVEGRMMPGPVDVYLTTDRGVYRAGEVIHVTALSRNDKALAIDGLPLTAILSRPDGVEYRREVSDGGVAGGHVFSFPVAADVPRGVWKIAVKSDPDGIALASQSVLIEDFMPERIDFDLALPETPLRLGDDTSLRINARYLFGAPGADLTIEGQVVARSTEKMPGFERYHFGRYDAEASSKSTRFGDARTDESGQAQVEIEIPTPKNVDKPIEVTVITRLTDQSGRPVERHLTAPARLSRPVIGINPLFEGVIPRGTEAAFEIIGLSPDLTPSPMRLRWTLNRIKTRYQWYRLSNRWEWNWEPTQHRTPVASGELDFTSAPLKLNPPVDWGHYELVVQRIDRTYAESAIDFQSGWYQAADTSTTPDGLDISLDRDHYHPGDTAQLRIVSHIAGGAQIEVLSDRLIHRQMIEVPQGETVIPLQVTQDWGVGAYVTATVVRPMEVSTGRNPARALGVAYATVEPVDQKLDVTIDVPEVSIPRQTQSVRIRVDHAQADDPVWLTLAMVDVGILNLTGFASPDPQGHFFGQRRLGVDLRDVYGRLIDNRNGAMGTIRSGGDDNDDGMRRLSPPPTQDLMAVFLGPIPVSSQGEVELDIALPAFNGTVRLMAMAWSSKAVGQAEADMIIRDPVVVTASLPRFLAPGDRSRMLLEIVHTAGPVGVMGLDLSVPSELELGIRPTRFALRSGGKAVFSVPVRAKALGDPEIQVTITTPDDQILAHRFRLPVRANDPLVAQTRRFNLSHEDRFVFSSDIFEDFLPRSASAVLSAGPLAQFNTAGLLHKLDRYPYGCTEQLTSMTLPLLYLSSVAQASGLGDKPKVKQRVQDSIQRILTRQSRNGAFGLWYPAGGDFWLDAYVTDFLSRARALGHPVPDHAFALAMENLRNRVNSATEFDLDGHTIAYALLVLARERAALVGDLRYYADAKGEAFGTPLAAAQLGAALALYGDRTRSDHMFRLAENRLAKQEQHQRNSWRPDYGTQPRDAAALLTLALEAGTEAIDREALIQQVSSNHPERWSPQELTWTLLAAHALISDSVSSGLRVNGRPVTGQFVRTLKDGQPEELNLTVDPGRSIDGVLTVIGIPKIAPPARGFGYIIERRYYSMEGDPLAPFDFLLGDRFVTVLEVTPHQDMGARLMVDDPLPAGIEIDNPHLLRSGDVQSLKWLDLSKATHTEFRSDRFLAAVDLPRRSESQMVRTITLAYVARAVSPGQFHHPAASVEDMYRPLNRANTETSHVTIR